MLEIADIVTTYIYTPDLSQESNSLVTLYGFGWGGLLFTQAVLLAGIVLFAYFPFVHYRRSVIQCGGFKEYVSMLYFGRPDKFRWVFIKSPKKKLLLLAPMGYTLCVCIITTKIYCVINNIAVAAGFVPCLFCFFKIPHEYHNDIHIHTGDGLLFIPIVLIAAILIAGFSALGFWHYREYKINQKALKSLENKPV